MAHVKTVVPGPVTGPRRTGVVSASYRVLCSCGALDVMVSSKVQEHDVWQEHALGELAGYVDGLDRFKAARRKTMVLGQPELLELVDLLRDTDGRYAEKDYWWYGPGCMRDQLEDVIGLKRGGLVTDR